MSTRPPRWLRLALPAACCAAFSVGITAQGACSLLFPGLSGGSGSSVVSPPTTIPLATRYVLVTGGGQPLPRVVGQAADGTVTRVLADTLTFAPAGTAAAGTFDEVAVLGVIRPGQAEVVTPLTAAGVAYTRQTNGITLAAVLALPTPGTVASVGGSVVTQSTAPGATGLQLIAAQGVFAYDAR